MMRYPKKGKGSLWTVRELECAPTDWQGDTLADSGGLFGEVRLTKAGTVSVRFRYRFRWEEKACWYQCGMWPAVSLVQIRKERDRARGLVAQGINPSLAKQAAKIEAKETIEATIAKERQDRAANLTVSDLFNEWIRDGVARADGNKKIRRAFELDLLPAIGNKPLRKLSDKDLLDVMRRAKERIIKKQKSRGANSSLVLLASDVTQMLRWAEKRPPWRGLLIAGNPADLIDIKRLLDADYQAQRDRVLTADEIKELYIGLSRLEHLKSIDSRAVIIQRMRFAIWLCLSTLCRIGELMAAKWEHIDWQAGTWLIPAENTKGKRGKRQGQLVILSDFALNQFKQLHKETGDSVYCFPAAKRGGHTQQATASSHVTRYQVAGGHYPVLTGGHWTLHDMRRTGATMMQSLGIPLEVIDRCQNHVLAGSRVRRHYLHYDYAKEKGEAWRLLGERLSAITQGQAH